MEKSKVYEVIRRYKNNETYTYQVQGRKKGEKARIPESIFDTLLNVKPDTGAWTVRKIYNLIMQEDIVVSDNTIKNFLKKYKLFTPYPKEKLTSSRLYVTFNLYKQDNHDDMYICHAYCANKKINFLLYNDTYANKDNEWTTVDKISSILYDFCYRCKSDMVYSSIQIIIENNICFKLTASNWNSLNKHYKYNLPQPVIKRSIK